MKAPLQLNNLGLPSLAGIATYAEACQPGLSVESSTELLLRYNYVKRRLVEIASAHITSVPEWELKTGLSLHLWLDAEHSSLIRKRVSEMREPPLHLDDVPAEPLRLFLDELLWAETSLELIIGIYQLVRPALRQVLEQHLRRTNPIADHPTVRILRIILAEEETMRIWGEQAAQALVRSKDDEQATQTWTEHLKYFLTQAGGISGEESQTAFEPGRTARSAGHTYQMRLEPQRDARFRDSFNTSEAAHSVYQDESRSIDERMFALIYKRLREMGVPEYLSAVLFRTPGKPWDYYLDLARQVWDEARHAMLGEVALYAHGMAFYEYPVNIHISTALNQLPPLEVHAVLWGVEQGLMPKNSGKHFEWKIAQAYGDPLCITIQDYDWADEVLHAQIGRRWLLPEFGDRKKLEAFKQEACARWQQGMEALRNRSAQEPWWDDFVEELRARRRITN